MKNIHRVDYPRIHAWVVRVERCGTETIKVFSDSVCGGRRKAHAMAKAYRAQVLPTLPKTRRHNQPPGPVRIAKVERSYVALDGRRLYFQAWVAWIRVAPHREAATNWSIDKWGSRYAKEQVKAWLEQKQREQQQNYKRALRHETNGR